MLEKGLALGIYFYKKRKVGCRILKLIDNYNHRL